MRSHSFLLFTALLSLGSGVPHATAQVTPLTPQLAPVSAHPHAGFIAEASQRFGIPEHWIGAVLRIESAGDVRAVSSAGAMGLMQVMPGTWAGLRIRHGLGRDPYDPRDNILAGTAYLREMWDRYGNVAAMLAAYNAGPGRYDEHLATGRVLPAETRTYIATLAPLLGGAAAPDAPTSAPPLPPDWREAPLFVARSGDYGAAANMPSRDARASVPVRDPVDADKQGGSIFVARASDGDAP
ncbi:soluble lytic murein transglycosylase-like protein [Amaricoccus macauensis]|uniref:Soluble lytic murein transglycosylase-like protein n=1 Tax=Amaricoccus macauensis TaxID=57001 RepID=A0A840SME5_9RHOB|nr:lytic transglycosylase domain-containing protein [Amaricoccus macauensis]MBB5221036.1 soluble lytic murein transglycosylase-like protein [Amaricoccus macauensis]